MTKKRTIYSTVPTVALAGLLWSGCATAPKQTWVRTGDPMVDGRTAIAQGPEKDKVLWQYRTGLAALRRGNYAEAEAMLDDALLTLGGITEGEKSARQSRRMFNEEAKKTFIGEPYERVMAYYYRGILYWMNGEPDNARACFRNAQIQDSDTEERTYANDYVLLDYLEGLANVKLSGDGTDQYKRAQESFKLGTLPEYNKRANTLVFLEFGQGPTKYASGQYMEQLRFKPGRSVVHGAWVKVANKAVRIGPYDDLNYQATTRGGRVMDHVLANKAVFKSGADQFGDVAIMGGVAMGAMGHRHGHGGPTEVQMAGLGLAAAGILSKVVAAATTPEADTRDWDNLPQYLSFVALDLPPGPHTATVEFTDAAGNVLPSYTKTVNFTVSEGNDSVVFVSDRSS